MSTFVNLSQAAELIGCSRNNISKQYQREIESPGTYSYFAKKEKMVEITDPGFIRKYGNHLKEWNKKVKAKQNKRANKKKKTIVEKKVDKEVVKHLKALAGGSISVTTKAPPKSNKPKTERMQEEEDRRLERERVANSGDSELDQLATRAAIAKYKKIIFDSEKAEIELKKSRAELIDIETMGETVMGYLMTLNQTILDAPRSFVDNFESGVKTGKSKSDLTDILRAPIMEAIKDTKEIITKELRKHKAAVKKANAVREVKDESKSDSE